MDREVWWATVHGVTKSQIWLSDSAHIHTNKRMEGRKEGRKEGKYFPPVLAGYGVIQGPPPTLSVLTWRIPWTEKSGGPQSIGSQRLGYD